MHSLVMNMKRLQQSGVSLIEVLIGILVLSVGVLGAIALQTHAASDVKTAYYKGQASSIALDLVERFRGNPNGADPNVGGNNARGSYLNAGLWSATPTTATAEQCTNRPVGGLCTPRQMAISDIHSILLIADTMLPQGQVWMGICDAADVFQTICVRVSWLGQDPATCVNNGIQTDCVQLAVYNPAINAAVIPNPNP